MLGYITADKGKLYIYRLNPNYNRNSYEEKYERVPLTGLSLTWLRKNIDLTKANINIIKDYLNT
jgi:hypothetical protein